MKSEPVTLDTPVDYFMLLDRSSNRHWWGRGIERLERRWAKSAICRMPAAKRDQLRWLDAGCGSGARLLLWSGWGCWSGMFGIEPEISHEKIIRGALNQRIVLKPGHLPEMQISEEKFDFITALDVIQHISFEFRGKAISELVENLMPGGLLLIRTNAAGFSGKKAEDNSIVSSQFLDDNLRKNGLKVLNSSHFNLTGSLIEDLPRYFNRKKRNDGKPMKYGLPADWQKRPRGSLPGWIAGWAESQIAATGLVKLPFGHSYIVLAQKELPHG